MDPDSGDRRQAEGQQPERRAPGEQRRYNRRSPVSDVPPPYYETFERIASALERIEAHLAGRPSQSGRGTVPPARSSERP